VRWAAPILSVLLAALASGPACAATEAAPWMRDGRPTPQARALVEALRDVAQFGLDPRDFAAELAILGSAAAPPRDSMAALDRAARRLLLQLHGGRVDPRAAGYALTQARVPLDVDAALRRVATAPVLRDALAEVEPRSAQYRALEAALARYRRIPATLARLPPAPTLRAGDPYVGAAQLARLLAAFGDLPADAAARLTDIAAAAIYDGALAAGVAAFQRRHGLLPDGVLGRRTFAALTVPVASRRRQIELTLERWRWLPPLRPPAVIVNVPQFVLYALDAGADPAAAPALHLPVVVGETARQTPIFDTSIEAVVFRPYWDVPRSIVRDELLPRLQREPDYLERHEMEIVAGDRVLPPDAAGLAALRAGQARLRQRPGRDNALGLIKFVMPNPYSVYLHSTPEPQLFSLARRALSHGCIRVSDATALAAWLLADTPGTWNADAIEAATCADTTLTVRLSRPVPVYVLYGTVVVDADGRLLFFDDIYGYDRRLERLLARGSRLTRASRP